MSTHLKLLGLSTRKKMLYKSRYKVTIPISSCNFLNVQSINNIYGLFIVKNHKLEKRTVPPKYKHLGTTQREGLFRVLSAWIASCFELRTDWYAAIKLSERLLTCHQSALNFIFRMFWKPSFWYFHHVTRYHELSVVSESRIFLPGYIFFDWNIEYRWKHFTSSAIFRS